MIEVRKKFSKDTIKKAWALKNYMGNYEFHLEEHNHHVFTPDADCIWSAKAYGWEKLLEKIDKKN